MSQPNHPPCSSRRTSLTLCDPPHNEPETQQDSSPHTPSAQIISGAEASFERYGGNDVHEPSPKEVIGNPSLREEPTLDANMVTWDGPNDPTNPQNWSIRYKWLVTAVCIGMSVNVYVYSWVSFFRIYKKSYNLEPSHRRRQHQRQQIS